MPSLRDVAYAPGSKPCSEMLFEMLRAQRPKQNLNHRQQWREKSYDCNPVRFADGARHRFSDKCQKKHRGNRAHKRPTERRAVQPKRQRNGDARDEVGGKTRDSHRPLHPITMIWRFISPQHGRQLSAATRLESAVRGGEQHADDPGKDRDACHGDHHLVRSPGMPARSCSCRCHIMERVRFAPSGCSCPSMCSTPCTINRAISSRTPHPCCRAFARATSSAM